MLGLRTSIKGGCAGALSTSRNLEMCVILKRVPHLSGMAIRVPSKKESGLILVFSCFCRELCLVIRLKVLGSHSTRSQKVSLCSFQRGPQQDYHPVLRSLQIWHQSNLPMPSLSRNMREMQNLNPAATNSLRVCIFMSSQGMYMCIKVGEAATRARQTRTQLYSKSTRSSPRGGMREKLSPLCLSDLLCSQKGNSWSPH